MFATGTGGTGSGAAGAPTPENPNDEAEQHRPSRRQRDVQGERDATRSEIAETVEKPRASDILHRVKLLMRKMESLAERMANVDATARKYLSGKDWEEWKNVETYLALEGAKVKVMHHAAEQIHVWHNGDLPPAGLRTFLIESSIFTGERQSDGPDGVSNNKHHILQAIDQGIQAAQSNKPFARDNKNQWETRNVSDRLVIVRTIEEQEIGSRAGETPSTMETFLQDVVLKDIDDRVKTWENELKTTNLEKFLDEFDNETKLKEGRHGGGSFLSTIKGLPSAVGVKFYSIEEIILAGKNVIDAYKESYRQKQQLNAATLSKQMGRLIQWLPWAGDVQQILDKELDSKNDEIKGKYADYLKNRNASYLELFGPGGEFMRNKHDGNRARGVLEYASHRGWLYDIDLGTKAADGHEGFTLTDGTIISFYNIVPKDWDSNRTKDEFSKLITEQGSGKDAETEKYYRRYYNVNDTAQFVHLVDEEMGKLNLWAVRGIVKRSIERGLGAEVTAWHATQIMDHIRTNQELRRIATKDWYDQMGTLAFYRTSFTLGGFKLDRDEMKKWREEWKDVTGEASIEDAGTLGRIISQLEQDICQRTHRKWTSESQRKELRRYIAKILGAQTVEIEGETFSIFENRYTWYRNSGLIKNQGDPHPGIEQEDPDYYTQVTDNLLAGARPVAAILARTGQGTFKEAEKASHYFGNIIFTHENLIQKGKNSDAMNFKREMGKKLNSWLNEQVLLDNRTTGLSNLLTKGGKSGLPALQTLIEMGYIDVRPIVDVLWLKRDQSALGLATDLLRKIDAQLFEKLDTLIKKKAKAESDDDKRNNLEEYKSILIEWQARQQGPITLFEQRQDQL